MVVGLDLDDVLFGNVRTEKIKRTRRDFDN